MTIKMDKLIQGLLMNDTVAATLISAHDIVETARELHKLSRACSAAMGRTLMQTAMMSMQLKNDTDRLTCILNGGGMGGKIITTASSHGKVKGYMEETSVEPPLAPNGKIDVAIIVGWFGDLTVIKDLGIGEPYIGKTRINSGEIAEDFANYYLQSEQQPCLDYLGVRITPQTGTIRAAGGMLLAPLPFCPEENIARLEENVSQFTQLTEMLETISLDECVQKLFADMDFHKTNEIKPMYYCDCSRERIELAFKSLGREEINSMLTEDHGAEVCCDYCNKKYSFSEEDLYKLLTEVESDR